MENKYLAEGKHFTNGKPVHPVIRKLIRWSRPSYKKHKARLIGDSVPVNWSVPYASVHGQIKNQQASFSCGGMAGSYLLAIVRYFNKLVTTIEELSAKSIYSYIVYPGGGTMPDDLETQLAVRGANLESDVPDMVNGQCTEPFMEDKSWSTPVLIEDAARRAGYTSMTVAITPEAFAEAIRDTGGLVMVIQGQNGQGAGWFAPYPTPPSYQNPNEIWEHFMCCFGYQAPLFVEQIDALQSWGIEVGDQGIQHFRQDYFDSGFIKDAFVLIPDDRLTPTGSSVGLTLGESMWQSACLWFKRQSWFK